jgi:tRNA(Ile)-lysidine synthase
MTEAELNVDAALLDRFRADLDALVSRDARIGIAVSGGPDSLALLLLAATARPGQIEAATIDHALRPEARDEAAVVGQICEKLGVPHAILTARWAEVPETAIQERARNQRYRLLGYWAEERGLDALATAHHAEDQAETVLMRLARGAGVRGLAGIRPRSVSPGAHIRLLRPLLGWRRAELEQICSTAGVTPAADPSNLDDKFERVRVRRSLGTLDWLDAGAVSQSATNLAEADAALDWAMKAEWDRSVIEKRGSVAYRPSDVPLEITRRIVARAIRRLATEGDREPRGPELTRLVATLSDGGTATLRGVLCRGGAEWHFVPSPNRTRPVDNYE